jgi:predicted DNA-binding transcriptional regulator AlpA
VPKITAEQTIENRGYARTLLTLLIQEVVPTMSNEELVPRPKVAKELGISHRTICRYETEKKPGFDRSVKIGGRVFHPRSRIDAVKTLGNLLEAEAAR